MYVCFVLFFLRRIALRGFFFPTVSEIAVVRCLFDMGMMDVCQPSSSLADDAIKGKWVRVPRDLNIQTGMWQLVRGKFFTCFHYTAERFCPRSSCIIVVLADETSRSSRTYNCSRIPIHRLVMVIGQKWNYRCEMASCAFRPCSCGTAKTRRSRTCQTTNDNR